MPEMREDIINATVVLYSRVFVQRRFRSSSVAVCDQQRVHQENRKRMAYNSGGNIAKAYRKVFGEVAQQPRTDPVRNQSDIPGQYQPWPNARGH